LIKAHGEVEKLMPYLHFTLQSGSDRILKTMNGNLSADDYRALVDKRGTALPGLARSRD